MLTVSALSLNIHFKPCDLSLQTGHADSSHMSSPTSCSCHTVCGTPIKPTLCRRLCRWTKDCTSAEPLTSLSGSCHVPAVCNTVKTQRIVLVLRISSQLLSSIWPQSERLNETLLPLEQWGVKSLASVASVRISIVLRTLAPRKLNIKCSGMFYETLDN